MFTNGLYCLKNIKMIFKMKTGQAGTVASTPEMMDSVNAHILTDRRVTIKEISEELRISAWWSSLF